jgi:class 3 adenylate cyclase
VDVGTWLRGLGLERYEQAFRDNDVDAEVLPELTEADLERLGVASLGHRKKLLREIATLRDGSASPSTVTRTRSVPCGEEPGPAETGQAERRQLTVMFVDLVGSTALSAQLDPEEMREVLRAYQNTVTGEIARIDGHVAKLMGDGVLATSAGPAHTRTMPSAPCGLAWQPPKWSPGSPPRPASRSRLGLGSPPAWWSSAPSASVSRSAPSGLAMPPRPRPPCRRRSSASPDHAASAGRR